MKTLLYLRSEYSLLQSLCDVEKTLALAKEYGYTALAITDYGHLGGVMPFKKACEKYGIKPLYGMEVRVRIADLHYPLILLAKNDRAYQKLMALTSTFELNDAIIDQGELNKYTGECFIIIAGDDMPLSGAFLNHTATQEQLINFLNTFNGDLVMGLYDNDKAINQRLNQAIKGVCDQIKVPTVAMSRCYYLKPEDEEAYLVLKAIKAKCLITDPQLINEPGRHLYSPKAMEELYDPDSLQYADMIARNCDVPLNFKTTLPLYQNNKGTSAKDYLVNLCRVGLKKRLKGQDDPTYTARLNHELKTILAMHFENYFLIVYDFVLYAKKQGILVGPGRGSAAGSLVAYCLGITDIDPLKYGLIFERFLNPERITMPDIDIDFPDDQRDKVINYCLQKYGYDHVAHIVTYGTLKAKQVLRDVGRVYNRPLFEIDNLCKTLPNDPSMTLHQGMKIPAFNARIAQSQEWRKILDIALVLEGLPRHLSMHAAGIVMSEKPLTEVVPLFRLEKDIANTQLTMEYLEGFGLIKMDFLALRNLTILSEIIADIRKNDHSFDIRQIPYDDQRTFRLLQRVDTLGIFQLESSGMQSLIRQLKPRNFAEIALTIALFRPGPMANIPQFVHNRDHPEKIKYLHEDLKAILEETYGIIVYQEQIIMIATKLAGFTMAKADRLRKAMSKKKATELESLSEDFIKGCIANGYARSLAEEVYALILKFANYGFNKSHSVAYARVAYEMAYLKANYPLYFYKALLNGMIASQSKTYDYLLECQKREVKVLNVNINLSDTQYIIHQSALVIPMTLVKDVGENMAQSIVKERADHGSYKSYEDAIVRLNNVGVRSNVLTNLIMAGAFDDFAYNRTTMLKNLDTMLKYAQTCQAGQMVLGGFDLQPSLIAYAEAKSVAQDEKATLGFFFTFNPMRDIREKYQISVPSLSDLKAGNGYVKGFGMVSRLKQHRTKKGDWMAFVLIYDESGEYELTIMPNLYSRYQGQLKVDDYLYFEGEKDRANGCLVKKMRLFKEGEDDEDSDRR